MAVEELDPELVNCLADHAKDPHYDEWTACFFVALDGNGGDWRDAAKMADEIAPTICGGEIAESLLEQLVTHIDYSKQDPVKHAGRIIQQIGRGAAAHHVSEHRRRIYAGGTLHTPEQKPAALEHYRKVHEHLLELHEPAAKEGDFRATYPRKVEIQGQPNREFSAHRAVSGLTHEHLSALTSGTHGSHMTIHYRPSGRVNVSHFGNGVNADREFEPHGTDDAGNDLVRLHNAFFRIDDDSPFKGHGYKFTANQVAALRAASVHPGGVRPEIRTEAAGPGIGGKFNGHYTWPRVGFEGEIEPRTFRSMSQPVRDAMGSSRSIRKLFDEVPGGKEEWQKKKIGIVPMTFDVTPGSTSSKALDKYAAERDAEAAKMRGS